MKKLLVSLTLAMSAMSASATIFVSNADYGYSVTSGKQHEWELAGIYMWGVIAGGNGNKFCVPANSDGRQLLFLAQSHYVGNASQIDLKGSAGVELTKLLNFLHPCK